MRDPLTTLSIAVLTLIALAASMRAIVALVRPDHVESRLGKAISRWALWLCALGAIALFVYRGVAVHQNWQPLQAHVDGLLLLAALFAATVLYVRQPSRLPGIAPFALPVLTLLLAWSVCASAWTLRLFDITSVWQTLHLLAVYLGSLFFCVAAIAGGMFLFVRRRLKTKQLESTDAEKPLPSLERIERVIIRTSALGFSLLSLGVVMGVVIMTEVPGQLSTGWWYSPKIVLATAVWLIFAVITNVRHATAFRGSRAAWLSIVGLVLILATFGTAAHRGDDQSDTDAPLSDNPVTPKLSSSLPGTSTPDAVQEER